MLHTLRTVCSSQKWLSADMVYDTQVDRPRSNHLAYCPSGSNPAADSTQHLTLFFHAIYNTCYIHGMSVTTAQALGKMVELL